MAADRELTPAEESLASILADAVFDDLLEGLPAGQWLLVSCPSSHDQAELAAKLRSEGLHVVLRERIA